jgi:hypothetical protein
MALGAGPAVASVVPHTTAVRSSAAWQPAARAVPANLAWHKLKLIHGWVSSERRAGPSADDAGPPSYKLADGVVHLSGEITFASGTDPIAFVLPKGARPAKWLYMLTVTDEWAPGIVEVAPDGDVYLLDGNFASVGSLAGISFSVSSGWHSLSLKNGWISLQSSDHTGTPSYRVSKGVVYLTGAVREGNSATSATFTVLPRSARPAHNLYITTYNIGGTVGYLYIESDGKVAGGGSDASIFTSLAGISFPLGS